VPTKIENKKKVEKKNKSATKTTANTINVPSYIICSRCEINFILATDDYCDVCKVEMGLTDKVILMPDLEEIGEEKLCPICNVTYIAEDEDICFLCAKEKNDKSISRESMDNWEEDLDDEDTIDNNLDDLSLTELEEKEDLMDEDDKDSQDDFEYIDADLDLEDDIDDDYDEEDE